MENKRILVTGGAGSIGSELVRQLAPKNKIFILDINETGAFDLREELVQKGHWVHSRTGDVRNKETVRDVFSDFKPEIVIHAAALKHVTPNNEYPQEAFATNIDGTVNVVQETKRCPTFERMVFISTDKVVNASCIMGITKLCAESYVRLQGDKYIAVRFGNVMRSRGSVLEIWERQHSNGEPLTLTDARMERYMMSIPQACELIIEALKSKHGGLMIMDMGERKKVIDLLEELYPNYPVSLIGLRPGEQLVERLMSEDEEKLAVREGKFYVLK